MVFPQNWGFPSLLLTTCFANYKSQVRAHHCQANVSLMNLLSCSPLCQISHLSCSITLFINASDFFFIHSFNRYLLCPYTVEWKTVHMDFFFSLKLGETKNRNGNHKMENEVKRRISLEKYSKQTSSTSLQTLSLSVSLLLVLLVVVIKKGPDVHVCCESYLLSGSQGHCSHKYPLFPPIHQIFIATWFHSTHTFSLEYQIKFF